MKHEVGVQMELPGERIMPELEAHLAETTDTAERSSLDLETAVAALEDTGRLSPGSTHVLVVDLDTWRLPQLVGGV
jgi:hypothetical protein